MQETKGFDQWALVELLGHQRIAGRVTEQQIVGAALLRVDVPGTETRQPITKYFGTAAIYAITPLSEETCRSMSTRISSDPISEWDAERLIAMRANKRLAVRGDDEELEDEEL